MAFDALSEELAHDRERAEMIIVIVSQVVIS